MQQTQEAALLLDRRPSVGDVTDRAVCCPLTAAVDVCQRSETIMGTIKNPVGTTNCCRRFARTALGHQVSNTGSSCLVVLLAVAMATLTLGVEIESSWGQWSACSTTCGVGVSHRVQPCGTGHKHCDLEAVQYRVCNEQVCPLQSSDPNTELCQQRAGEQFPEPHHHWEAVYKPGTGNPCALLCSSTSGDDGQVLQLSEEVPDGTWCSHDGKAICIGNQCLTPGCDNILGSSNAFDSCGVCGGNGTSCSDSTGGQKSEFMWKLAWTLCSVSCGVGLKTQQARCVKADTRQTVSDELCQRKDKPDVTSSSCFREACRTDAQSDDPVSQSDVSSTEVAKDVFRGLQQYQTLESSGYQVGEWSACSVTCGTGTRIRDVMCNVRHPSTDESLPGGECFGEKPSTHEKCHVAACGTSDPLVTPPNQNSLPNPNFRWDSVGFTDCSRSCAGGKQQSKIGCLRDDGQVVRPTQCSHLKKPRVVIRNCNTVPCPPRWEVGDYGACSKLCGAGVMLRLVQCMQEEVGGVVTFLEDFRCPEPAPEREKICNAHYCQSRWATGPWSECSTTCGTGTQSRETSCVKEPVAGREVKVRAVECQGPEPVTSRSCENADCPENTSSPPVIKAVNYTFTQLRRSKRLKLAVGGKVQLLPGQSLVVRCPVENFHRRLIFWSKNFKLVPMAGRVRATFNGNLKIRQANPQTDAGTYTCLAGHESADVNIEFLSRADVKDQIRHIQHYLADTSRETFLARPGEYKDGVVQDVGYNSTKQILYVTGNWSDCSVTCGAGHQKRDVTCTRISYKYVKYVPDRVCEKLGLVKPSEMQKCSHQPDCPHWIVGNWEKCSLNTCVLDGYAERRRPLSCLYTNGSLALAASCDVRQRPDSARRCFNADCVSEWTTTPWTACRPSCGDKGVKMRMLECTWQKTNLPAWSACKHKDRPPATKICKLRPCPGSTLADCNDRSRYCSLAHMLRMCRYEDFRYKCCRSCAKISQSTLS